MEMPKVVSREEWLRARMVRLMGSDAGDDSAIRAALSEWQLMNHGRHVLTFAGWLAALRALSVRG
jgi:hypothetical protein